VSVHGKRENIMNNVTIRKCGLRKIAAGFFLVLAAAALSARTDLQEYGERRDNERQPPDKVMNALGIKPGLTIGEVGAGHGRYTVHLAARVGPAGKVYAEDIDSPSLDYLRGRIKRTGLSNVEVILGKVDDPLFPKAGLDMVFMVWVYHMLESPAALLKNIVPGLKPGATIVMVEPVPDEIEAEISNIVVLRKR